MAWWYGQWTIHKVSVIIVCLKNIQFMFVYVDVREIEKASIFISPIGYVGKKKLKLSSPL